MLEKARLPSTTENGQWYIHEVLTKQSQGEVPVSTSFGRVTVYFLLPSAVENNVRSPRDQHILPPLMVMVLAELTSP